ncbi:MAG TPA: DUF4126 domain-containing protein [Gemmatimonadota bacterium]|nr:DUF4126 domain-containing protein [Gemmatimonadota bacterium]
MSGLESLGHALAFAVGAGINLYATVLVLGLAARFDWVDVPGTLEPVGSAWVIGGAAALYLIEFLADKIPWIDSLWDAIHTLVRPIGAAVIAVAALGPASPGMEVAAGLLGAAIGASTHAAKAGTRLAVNASPEPATNIAVSLLEDGFVVGLVLLLLTHPLLGLALAVAALVSVVVLLAVLFRLVTRRRRRREPTIS